MTSFSQNITWVEIIITISIAVRIRITKALAHKLVQFSTLIVIIISTHVGGAMASWLVRSSPDRVVRVRALAGDIVLCSWARHLTLTVPLSTQVYEWVPANLMLGVTLRWTGIPSRGE